MHDSTVGGSTVLGVVDESIIEAEVPSEWGELLPINSCSIFVTVSNWEAEIDFSKERSSIYISIYRKGLQCLNAFWMANSKSVKIT